MSDRAAMFASALSLALIFAAQEIQARGFPGWVWRGMFVAVGVLFIPCMWKIGRDEFARINRDYERRMREIDRLRH